MREPGLAMPPPAAGGPGRRLVRAVRALAVHLSGNVERLGGAPDEPLRAQRELIARLFGRAEDEPAGERAEHDDPLDRLTAALALSPFEVDLLLLAGLPNEHEALSLLLRSFHPRGEPYPTVGLAAQLFCRDDGDRLLLRGVLETGALVSSGAVRLADEVPFADRNVVLAEGLWAVLHGHDVWPASLRRVEGRVAMEGLGEWLQRGPAQSAIRALRAHEPRTVIVLGDTEEIALQRAAALAVAAGVPAVRLGWDGKPGPDVEQLICVHCFARGVVPLLRVSPPEGPSAPPPMSLERHAGPVVLCVSRGTPPPRTARPLLQLDAEHLSAGARTETWREILPELGDLAPSLAARYSLEPCAVAEIAADLRSLEALERRPLSAADVADAVRSRSIVAGTSSIKLIRPKARWEQLVLVADTGTQLREAVARLERQRTVLEEWGFLQDRPGARGVRLLLSGPPGTGKSLSAEVLANALGVDLMAVDISRLVSKWIGETEKNLSEVFDAAERAQAVLFFDEADALFGARTEVSDAHDRYANLETAYLLFRLERFEGMVVLATNLRANVDPAFVRRLEFVIDYDEPDRAQREALWRVHIPPRAPVAADVDLEELAALYPVVGGFIKNAAVAAAFLAATEGGPIRRSHLVHAVKREYQKSGKAFPGYPPGMKASRSSQGESCQPR